MPGSIVVSLQQPFINADEKVLLSHKAIGGVALFKENWDKNHPSPKDALRKLIQEIRSVNPQLIIMVDHEGGHIWRFEEGFTKLPSAQTMGVLFERQGKECALDFIYEQANKMATELLDCGIDITLAPVVDLLGNSQVIAKYERAFHRDPEVVVLLAEAFIKGMNDAGMPGTIKHFPGHGTCHTDSHTHMAIDERSMSELQSDLFPFKKLIEKKLDFAVMTNHVLYPQVDVDYPAGFSKIWIKGCLRMGYGFDNLIMSDCLSMKGADIGAMYKRILQAQVAGHDLILVTHQHGENLKALVEVLDLLPEDVESARRRECFLDMIKRRDPSADKTLQFVEDSKRETVMHNKNNQTLNFNTHKGIL